MKKNKVQHMTEAPREYRGKSLDTGKWVYGYLVFGNNKQNACIVHKQGNNEMHMTAVDPKTVGQFTGYLMNKKKVFEGDVLHKAEQKNSSRDRSYYSIVKWLGVRWVASGWNGEMRINPELGYRNMDIVGNIHDNPEFNHLLWD